AQNDRERQRGVRQRGGVRLLELAEVDRPLADEGVLEPDRGDAAAGGGDQRRLAGRAIEARDWPVEVAHVEADDEVGGGEHVEVAAQVQRVAGGEVQAAVQVQDGRGQRLGQRHEGVEAGRV